MAFVPGYEYDVFISYAHIDNNKRLDTDPRGWVEDLFDVVQKRLARCLGRADSCAIWWDPHLKGYDRVDPVIADKVRKSALFLCVLSPAYVASSYCLEELQLFDEASRCVAHAEFVRRILNVKLMPVRTDRAPALLKEVKGYDFYALDQKSNPREFWRNNQNAVNEVYWERALELADDIARLLEEIKNQQPAAAPAQVKPALPTVYLAQTTDELAEKRRSLRQNLNQQGIKVLPDTPLVNDDHLTVQIVNQLRAAHLGVHLVGAEFGERAFGESEPRSLAHVQYLRAKELELPRIVWLAPGLPGGAVPDERQRRFLRFLEDELAPEAQVDLQHGLGFESLVEEIVNKTYAAAGKPRPNARARRGGAPQIDIACQEPDRDEAMDIKKLVYQNKFDVNVAVDDSPAFSTRYQHILKRSDALLILYGKASPSWVADRADQAREAVLDRTRAGGGPLVALVYDGPPPDKRDLPFGYHEVAVLTSRNQVARDEIVSTIKNHLGV